MPHSLMIGERNDSWAGRSREQSQQASREEAEAALPECVQRNWVAEMGTEPPHDPDETVPEYCSEVHEAYEIRESAEKDEGEGGE